MIDGGAGFDTGDASFADQTGDVIAVNGGVTGRTYGFTVAGKAFGSVTGIEKMTGLTGGKGDDRLGGVYTLGSQYATIAGGDGTDTAVVDLSDDTAGFSGGLNNAVLYNQAIGYTLTLSGIEVLELTGNAINGGFGFGVFGGDGADILTGLGNADIFQGGGGNDRVRGNGGDDDLYGDAGIYTAVFTGSFASYAVSFPGPDLVEVSGPDGRDTLHDFEIVAFNDGVAEVVGGTIGNAFTIAAATLSAAEGQSGTAIYTFTRHLHRDPHGRPVGLGRGGPGGDWRWRGIDDRRQCRRLRRRSVAGRAHRLRPRSERAGGAGDGRRRHAGRAQRKLHRHHVRGASRGVDHHGDGKGGDPGRRHQDLDRGQRDTDRHGGAGPVLSRRRAGYGVRPGGARSVPLPADCAGYGCDECDDDGGFQPRRRREAGHRPHRRDRRHRHQRRLQLHRHGGIQRHAGSSGSKPPPSAAPGRQPGKCRTQRPPRGTISGPPPSA